MAYFRGGNLIFRAKSKRAFARKYNRMYREKGGKIFKIRIKDVKREKN